MSETIKILAWVVCCCAVVGFAFYVADCLDRETNTQTIEDGRHAYSAGVPAQANPYGSLSTYYRSLWLEGWIQGAEADKPKPELVGVEY